MKLYLISYNLKLKATFDYTPLFNYIERLSSEWFHGIPDLYIIETSVDKESILSGMKSFISKIDSILIFELNDNVAISQHGLTPEGIHWLSTRFK